MLSFSAFYLSHSKLIRVWMSFLFLLLNTWQLSYGQDSLIVIQTDTLWLKVFQHTILKTNNGADCTCEIRNPAPLLTATIANMGAPKLAEFTNQQSFNGAHLLPPGNRLLIIANFKGKELTISNYSEGDVSVIVSIVCK